MPEHDPSSRPDAAMTISEWWSDIVTAASFLTRLPLTRALSQAVDEEVEPLDFDEDETLGPIGGALQPGEGRLARASRAFPLVGLMVGAIGAAAFGLARGLGLGPTVAAILAVAALMVVTGALHEDGLADVADGFAGGHDRAQKLAIMHDPSIGTFAVLALVIAVALRVAAIGAIGTVGDQGGGTWPAMAAVIAAASYSRGVLPVIMHGVGPARSDGLAVEAGRPSQQQALLAVAIGAAIALLTLGLWAGLAAIVAGAAAALLLAALARAEIGGITGDVLGAIQQACEVAVLLAAAALL